jgi:hypothetical protein
MSGGGVDGGLPILGGDKLGVLVLNPEAIGDDGAVDTAYLVFLFWCDSSSPFRFLALITSSNMSFTSVRSTIGNCLFTFGLGFGCCFCFLGVLGFGLCVALGLFVL